MIRIIAAVIISVSIWLNMPIATAAPSPAEGLSLAPSRYELTFHPGDSQEQPLVVTNHTPAPMTVYLNIKQFSVGQTDSAIQLRAPEYDWVAPSQPSVVLEPGQAQSVPLRITIPRDVAGGEYYVAAVASTTVAANPVPKTLQVASLAYIYIDGGAARHQGDITDSRVPPVVLGPAVSYAFSARNTGNIHMRAQATATLSGLGSHTVSREPLQTVVFPGHSRPLTGTVAMPFWPGVYTLSYGFNDATTNQTTMTSATVAYIPPWSIVAAVLVCLIIVWIGQHLTARKRSSSSDQ